jgi:hypothetical protein
MGAAATAFHNLPASQIAARAQIEALRPHPQHDAHVAAWEAFLQHRRG